MGFDSGGIIIDGKHGLEAAAEASIDEAEAHAPGA